MKTLHKCRGMGINRRDALSYFLPFSTLTSDIASASTESNEVFRLSVPGPRNLSYLPIDLIPRLNADQLESVNLRISHTGGGGLALAKLASHDVDFAVAGAPAVMSMRHHGGQVVIVAAVNDAPVFVLIVRSALAGRVRRIADLRGLTVGVNTGTPHSKTTSQQLAELLLASDGVKADEVRFVPAGQSWDEQSSMLITGAADAILGDEPYATALRDQGKGYFLIHLAQAGAASRIPGGNFLHAVLATRPEIVSQSPERVAKMVRILKRSLAWLAKSSAFQSVELLGISNAQRRSEFVRALTLYPSAFSRDGSFSKSQLLQTDVFYKSNDTQSGLSRSVVDMIDARWVGLRP